MEAMKKIRDAANVANAEMAMKEIKGFEEKIWNTVSVGCSAVQRCKSL